MAPEVSPTIFTDDGGAENWHEEIILSFILSSIHSFIFDAFLSNCSLLISSVPPTSLSSFFFHCVIPLFIYSSPPSFTSSVHYSFIRETY